MNGYIIWLREKTNLTQKQMADELGVSFATLNRWENERTNPDRIAQLLLYEFCVNHDVDLENTIHLSVGEQFCGEARSSDVVKLFHGSKAGIAGEISPSSRMQCDFGSGFYMGDRIIQPLQLISDYDNSSLYSIEINLKGLKVKRLLPDLEWALIVASHRGRISGAEYKNIEQHYLSLLDGIDICIGPIADDRMYKVIDDFFSERITDTALVNCLAALNLGQQYVALTDKACSRINITGEHKPTIFERKCLTHISMMNRRSGVEKADEICKVYRRTGRYFDEILDEFNEKV